MENLCRIGRLAEKTGVTPRTIRFYVQKGLIQKPVHIRKNMALYPLDCIEQIRAIKRAQSRRFLPLVVIRKILEQHDYDYSVLETARIPRRPPPRPPENDPDILDELPDLMRRVFETKGWLQKMENGDTQCGRVNYALVKFLVELNRQGTPWEELVKALGDVEALVQKAVDKEHAVFSKWAMVGSLPHSEVWSSGAAGLESFFWVTRKHHLKELSNQHQRELDYSLQAVGDEGFSTQADEILPLLESMARKSPPPAERIQHLNELAMGYSCIGDVDTSLELLNQVLKESPEDLNTQARLIWYSRFVDPGEDDVEMKRHMANLVSENPDFAMARLFLGSWHVLDSLNADTPDVAARLRHLGLAELIEVEENIPADPHWNTLARYGLARVFMAMPGDAGYLGQALSYFESILVRKGGLDFHYAAHLPFFPKWLWPNIYYFYGSALVQAGEYGRALELFTQGAAYKMAPPFKEHIEAGIQTANAAIQGERI
ncbi:MAG: MerR family transcriptional regulator [Desulfobacterales bacterium]|nr:MerR family transcriptional regulator [Desulfobacterales bacterium]